MFFLTLLSFLSLASAQNRTRSNVSECSFSCNSTLNSTESITSFAEIFPIEVVSVDNAGDPIDTSFTNSSASGIASVGNQTVGGLNSTSVLTTGLNATGFISSTGLNSSGFNSSVKGNLTRKRIVTITITKTRTPPASSETIGVVRSLTVSV